MAESKPFPLDLREWVASTLPGVDEITDVSWPRGSSRVWRVAAGSNAAFVKLSLTEIDYDREVLGYAYAARNLTDHQAPRLLAVDPDLKAIMTSPLPGTVVRGLPLETEVEQRVHEAAGRLLRRWHDQSDPGSEQDRHSARAAMREQAREALSGQHR
ncbi:phosphotransferase [Pseudonocardia sp. GCM10023141]|uniref:phosphotransferase n=1 Tax=Pseudonocardia sp. GCM10023141 TaxID=3252653 RepID=UPI00361C80B1